MSAEPTTDLDADIRAAFAALDAQVASRPEYLASFESRLLARMEEQAVTESINESAVSETGDVLSSERPRTRSTEESSGLHDIRALAQSAKMRISQSMSQARRESSLLASSSLALRVVALPDPAKQQVHASAAAASRSGESDESQPLPAWIYAAIGAVAATAVVFFILRGGQGAGEPAAINHAPAPSQPTLGMERAVVPAAPEPGGELAAGALPTDDGEAAGADVGGAREPADPAGSADSKPPAGAVLRDEWDESARARDEASARTASPQRAGSSKKESGGSSGAAPESKAGVAPVAATGANTGAVTGAAPDGTAADSQQPEAKTGSDPIEALFSETSASSAKPQGAGSGVPTRTKLDTGDLRKAMAPLQGKADACFDKHQVPGQVMIRFSVAPSGEVISASATGQFQGTDTGKCVADVVKSASFPSFDGAQMSFNYPFLLAQ